MTELTHEQVSADLRAYAEGGLDAARSGAIDAHLRGCSECRQELTGVMALTMLASRPTDDLKTDPLAAPMSDSERALLHREVRSALVVTAPSWSERWGRRFAPAVGAAALLALIAVGIVSLDSDQEAQNATVDATTEEASGQEADSGVAEGLDDAEVGAEDDSDLRSKGAAGTRAGGSASKDGVSNDAVAQPQPAAGAAATESSELSIAAGRDRAGFTIVRRSFARSTLDPRDLIGVRNASQIANYSNKDLFYANAPRGRLRDILRECVETMESTSPFELTATSATFYPRDDILVVTFVWIDDSRALNYELRGWRGGACDRPSPIYRRGRVS